VAWSPDGRFIASASDNGNIRVWNAGTAQTLITRDNSAVYQPSFDNLGRPIPQRNDDIFYAPGTNIFATAWSPNGIRIVATNVGGYILTWDALSRGSNSVPYNGNAGFVNALAWSPDGLRIAAGADGTSVQIWQG
jgi:WD40 repeat protein